MRCHVLATDYDGTLAMHGRVDSTTVESLRQLLATGRRLIMDTGRQLPEYLPRDRLIRMDRGRKWRLTLPPCNQGRKPLAEPPGDHFIQALRAKNVGSISVGRVIVATWEPHQVAVIETIHLLDGNGEVVFHRGRRQSARYQQRQTAPQYCRQLDQHHPYLVLDWLR